MKVRLTRISGGTALRTAAVEGTAEYPPVEGQSFTVLAPGLEFGTRIVQTSPVVEVIHTPDQGYGSCEMRTETGSVYRMELLTDDSVAPASN